MAGYIEDRWLTKRPAPETGKRRRTARYGQGKRYRVAGVPGVRDRSFESLTGPDGANAWKAKAEHESTKGEFINPRDGNILLRDYVETQWWPSLRVDLSTEETIHGRVWNHVLPQLGGMKLRDIKVATLRVWVKGMEKTVGPGTANAVWGYLSNILEYAIDDERIARNPCKAKTIKAPVSPERKARAWQRDRVRAVKAALHAPYRILVDVGAGAGLRQGEAFGLDADLDIDEIAEVIHVRRQVKRVAGKLVFAPPKGGKERTVPMPRYLAAEIRAHKKAHPPRRVTLPWRDPRPRRRRRRLRSAPLARTTFWCAARKAALSGRGRGTSTTGRRLWSQPALSHHPRSASAGRRGTWPTGTRESSATTPYGTPKPRCSWTRGSRSCQSQSGSAMPTRRSR
ncbi:tyrosine recombinase XerC [Streptomyces niveus]|uniref:site-specific integrase n=1 Tax=Streptomyces niveus TaxID=193462 RepID=UPI0036E7B5B1